MNDQTPTPWIYRRRRKLRSQLVDPRRQLRLPVILLAITVVFSGLIVLSAYEAFGELVMTSELGSGRSSLLSFLLADQVRNFGGVVAALGAIYVAVVFGFCVYETHRMLGPAVVFQRQLEALKNGDYAARCAVREGDAFAELARDLNELAEALESADKATGASSST